MHSFRYLILTLAFTALCTGTLHADELRLNDQSVITGEVTKWSAENIVIKTTFAGELSIPRAMIKEIIADEPVLVEVSTGDKIIGTLVVDKDKGQLLTGTTFGDLKVDMSRVTSISAADDTTANSVSTPPVATAPVAEGAPATLVVTPPPFEPATPLYNNPPTKWSARFELGADGSTGNTERLTTNGKIQVRRTTETDRLLLFLQGTYAKQNGSRSANEIIGGADLEVDLTKNLYAFGKASLEYDEFENLDMRALVTAGVGYFWIRQDEQFLKTRGGVGYMHESFSDNMSRDTGILELGVDYMKQVNPWLVYNHSTTYYPTLSSVSDFRIVMENSAEIPLTKDKDWKIRMGIRNSYDSAPEPGIERLDTTYFANLVWDFK